MGTLDMDELDRLLAPPEGSDGAARWEALGKLLTQPAWDKAADQWMERAERALEAWPDAVRVWPHAWFKRKVAPRATRLVRTLKLGEQSAAGHSAIFAQLATLDEEATPRLAALELAYSRYNIKKQPANLIDAAQASILMAALERTGAPTLRISGGDSAELWAALAGAPAMASVRRFECTPYMNPHIKLATYSASFEALLASPHLSGLTHLHLYSNGKGYLTILSERVVEQLITHHAHRLIELSMPPTVDKATLAALCAARWPALRSLRSFGLMTLEQLAQSMDNAPALETLRAYNRLFGAPAQPGQTASLRELMLSRVQLDEEQTAALLSDARLAKLERLDLIDVLLDARGASALSAMPLTRLNIEPKHLFTTWPAMQGQRFERLETLHAEARTMADLLSLELPALMQLELKLHELSMEDLDALEAAPWFAQLRRLIIHWRETFGALAQRVQDMMQAINATHSPSQE